MLTIIKNIIEHKSIKLKVIIIGNTKKIIIKILLFFGSNFGVYGVSSKIF